MTAKTCTRCDETKPLDEFPPRSDRPGAYKSRCKVCERLRIAAWRANNPGKVSQYNRTSHQRNPRKHKPRNIDPELKRLRDARWRDANRDKLKDRDARRRAAKLGTATGPVDLAAVSDCYLCGEQLTGDVHADHVVPLARGGEHSAANLRPTHANCNLRKGTRLLSELDWYQGPGVVAGL